MKIKKCKEKWSPKKENLALVREIILAFSSEVDDLKDWFLKYGKSHQHRLAFDLDYLDELSLTENQKVLEIGALPFILTQAMIKKGLDVSAVDVNPLRMNKILTRYNLRVLPCDVETENLPFPDNSFDVILLNEVFEHLRINPIFTHQEIKRVLKDGGKLFLSTPNLTSLKGWYSLIFKNKAPNTIYGEYEKLTKLGHMGHVREYTPTEITEFLEALDFKINRVIYRGLPTSATKWKQLSANIILTIFPALRRYFTVIAEKKDVHQ